MGLDGVNNNGTPQDYTKIKMYDEKTKKTQTFLVPVGKQITVNGKTYDPSKGKNNELVFKGTKGGTNFDMISMTLEHMDVNKDGKIDKNDTDSSIDRKLNKELKNKGSDYRVKYVDVFSDAGVDKGIGGASFRKDDGNGDFKFVNIHLE